MKSVATSLGSPQGCAPRTRSLALAALVGGASLALAPLAAAQGDPPGYGPASVPSADPEVKAPAVGPTQAAVFPQDEALLAATPRAERVMPPPVGPKAEEGGLAALLRDRTQVIVDPDAAPGLSTAVGKGWKALFSADGLSLHPRVGRAHPSQPTDFRLARATLGGAALDVTPATVSVDGLTVTLGRGGLREVYHLAVDALEQTFVFDALPGAGELVVDLAVQSPWAVTDDGTDLAFVAPGLGAVRYGRAWALDATGARTDVERTWTGEGIRLTVPAEFVAGATLPLTIDPVIGTLMEVTTDPNDDRHPDVAFSDGAYWLAFQDWWSATDADVLVCSLSPTGVFGALYSIDTTVDYWEAPAIAAAPVANRVLVVASTTPDGPGSGVADIEGRLFDTTALSAGVQFVIDQTGFASRKPDVGGTWTTAPSLADFCVVWEREWNLTDHDILARVVASDGTFVTDTLSVANLATDDDYAPAVSKSRGDEALIGDYWNLAWIRDNDQNGIGTPYTHRVYYTGGLSTVGARSIFGTAYASNVDVSSTFDEAVPGTSDRPYIVTFDRDLPNLDIYTTVCTENSIYSTDNISLLEDFDQDLLSRDPSIATDGVSFFLAYDELWWGTAPPSTDYDTYALSGNIARSTGSASVALSERHARLDYISGLQQHCTVTSRWDGGGQTDDALVVWEDYTASVNGGARTKLMFYDSNTGDGSAYQAIGRQYCDANAHADSGDSGRRSSFLYAVGTGSVTGTHALYCVEMKLSAFGYFIVSTAPGDVNMPGSSVGRLCLGGAIGRAVGGTVANSGTGGSIWTVFSPQVIPTPTGTFAALPGQTLYFQCWHRDVSGGIATSNFSNAVSIRFVP